VIDLIRPCRSGAAAIQAAPRSTIVLAGDTTTPMTPSRRVHRAGPGRPSMAVDRTRIESSADDGSPRPSGPSENSMPART
jgi:hypothetical protein